MDTNHMATVNVLMATYNGEAYIKQQIDSIRAQEGVSVRLTVRDDGSGDATLAILESYQQAHQLSYATDKEHLGPAKGFLRLLRQSEETDYYAFSDQDDYWQSDKLATAIEMLSPYGDAPCLYFSRTQLTDARLQPIPSPELNPRLTFGESLIYEFIPGCTMVMNRALRDIVNSYRPDYLPMHDVWVYSVAQAVGAAIVFDRQPHILYRQHATNAVGQGYSIWHEWHRRWKRLVNSEHSRSRRAAEIVKGYKTSATADNLLLLEDFLKGKDHLWQRLRLCADTRLRCARHDTQLLFWVNLLLNTY